MKKLPRWFLNRIHTIMEYNNYSEDMFTTQACDMKNRWTPVDLILREYYNNNGFSSKGFLGIPRRECIRCYEFIRENQQTLKDMDYYNEKGFNNSGFLLWSHWNIH